MITELTKEQEALIPVIRDRWLNKFYSLPKLDKEKCRRGVEWIYESSGFEKPQVLFFDCPLSIQVAANILSGNIIKGPNIKDVIGSNIGDNILGNILGNIGSNILGNIGRNILGNIGRNIGDNIRRNIEENIESIEYYDTCWYGNIGDYFWMSYAEFYQEAGLLDFSAYHFHEYKDYLDSGIFTCIQFENICLVCSMPEKVHLDEEKRLHNPSGPAVEWASGFKQYFIHGRPVDEKLFIDGFTKDEYLKESNEDTRAAMYEIIEAKGEGSMMEFLGASLVDSSQVVHACGEVETIELYKTNQTFEELDNKPLAWVKFICPSTGSSYLLSTKPDFQNSIEAAKFHRDDAIPFDLEYSWHSRS